MDIHNLLGHSSTEGHYFQVYHYKQGHSKYPSKDALCTGGFISMGESPWGGTEGWKGM